MKWIQTNKVRNKEKRKKKLSVQSFAYMLKPEILFLFSSFVLLEAMESPRNHGGSEEEEEEEYSSCESGWTMYIEDAFHGNDHSSTVVDDDEDDDDDSQVKEADDGDSSDDGGDEESDDSMASDASSGPSNQHSKNINKHAAKKKIGRHLQKRQYTEKSLSNEGEKSELKARTSAGSRVQSRGKLNKTK